MSYSVASSSIFSSDASVSSEEASASLLSVEESVEQTLESFEEATSTASSSWWHAEKLSEAFTCDTGNPFSCGGNYDYEELGPDDEIRADKGPKSRRNSKNNKNNKKPTSQIVVENFEHPSPATTATTASSNNPASNFLAKYHKMKAEAANLNAKMGAVMIGDRLNTNKNTNKKDSKDNNKNEEEDVEQGNHRGWGSANKGKPSKSNPFAKNGSTKRTQNRSTKAKVSPANSTPRYRDILKGMDSTDVEDDEESIDVSIIENDDEDTYDGTLDDTIDDTLTYDNNTYQDEDTLYDGIVDDAGNDTNHARYGGHHSHSDVVSTAAYSDSVGARSGDSRNDRMRSSESVASVQREQPSVGSRASHEYQLYLQQQYQQHQLQQQQQRYYDAQHNRSFGSYTTATASVSSGSSYGTNFNKSTKPRNNKPGSPHRNSNGGLAASYLYKSNKPKPKSKPGIRGTGSYQIAAGLSTRSTSTISEESQEKRAAVRTGKLTPTQKTNMAKTRKERLLRMGRNSIHSRSVPVSNKQQKQFPYNIDHSGFQAAAASQSTR